MRISDVIGTFEFYFKENQTAYLSKKDMSENEKVIANGYNDRFMRIYFKMRYFMPDENTGSLLREFQTKFAIA